MAKVINPRATSEPGLDNTTREFQYRNCRGCQFADYSRIGREACCVKNPLLYFHLPDDYSCLDRQEEEIPMDCFAKALNEILKVNADGVGHTVPLGELLCHEGERKIKDILNSLYEAAYMEGQETPHK